MNIAPYLKEASRQQTAIDIAKLLIGFKLEMNRFNGFQLTIRYFGRLFSSTPTLPTAMGMVTEVVVLDPFPVVGTAPLPDEGPIPGSKRPSPESRRRVPPWDPGGDRSIIDGHTAFIFTRRLTCHNHWLFSSYTLL